MPFRRRAVATRVSRLLSVIALVALTTCLQPVARAQELQVLHNHVRPEVQNHQAKLVGALPAAQQLQASIVLPLRNQAALTSLLGRLYDPASPDYRHFLTVAGFTEQFGPTVADFQAVVAFAEANGLTVSQLPRNRLIVPVTGSVARINAAFNVQMSRYQHPTENRTFISPDREPSLNLGVPVSHISGLDSFSIPRPMSLLGPLGTQAAAVLGSGPGGSYLGSDMRAAYYGGTTLDGNGQAVGILEFGGYSLSDVNLTFSNAGQSYHVPINNVLLDGATGGTSPNGDAEEVLDIVQAIGMAPNLTQVRVYIGNAVNGIDDANVLNTMTSENLAKQLSCSWSWKPVDPTVADVFFQEMAAQGQSFFTASGDDGAFDSAISSFFYPAEDQFVTAVGGTHLTTTGAGGGWVSETVWNTSPYGSGGGISPDGISIPSWQAGLSTTANGGSSTLRNVPDVAMEGDFDNYACSNGVCNGGYAGTSFAAPRWAGFMALVNQQAVESGNAPAGGLGFLNPSLYRLGQGATTATDFHDITVGNNDSDNQPVFFNATVGYDLTTGWGSANGQSLIDDLAGPQVPGFWLASAQSTLSVAPGGTTADTLSVTDAGGFNGSITLSVSSTLPSGVTASFSPNPATSTSVLTLTATSGAPTASQLVTLTATSGSLTASTNVTVGVNPPSFGLGANPSAIGINQGGASTSTITVIPLYGFTGSVSLAVAGLPSGVTASFSPVSTTGTSTLTLTASSTAPGGTSTLTVTGTSGTLTATASIILTIHAPSFTLSASSPLNIGQGSSGSDYVYLTDLYGFTGSVNLSVSGLPAGVTATILPNPISSSTYITFAAASSTVVGQYTVTITGTSGSLTAITTMTLGIFAPTFTLSGSSSVSVGQGGSGTSYLYVEAQYGFTGSVNMSVSGLPAGVTAVFSPNPTTYSTTLSITTTSSAAVGQYTLTITGTSGSQTATSTLVLGIFTPTFTLSSSGSLNIGQGSSGNAYVYVNPEYGFTGSVSLVASGLPSGVTAAFSPNPATGTSSIILLASSTAALGQYTVTITGTSGSQTASTTLTVGVYVSTFTLGNYGNLTVGQGSTTSGTVYVTALYGFTGSVSLSVTGLPTGVTAAFSPNPATGNSQLTIAASSTAALGQYTLTIKGTSGTQTATTTLTLGVYQPTFTLSGIGSISVSQGYTSSGYISVNNQYGFSSSVALSVSGLPTGVTASFSPNPTTGTSYLTLTASSSAALGQYSLLVSGTAGSITATTPLTLTVAAPTFTMGAYGISAGQGSTGSTYIYVTGQNGFNGSVNLAVSGLPAGVSASFGTNPTTFSSLLTLTIGANTPIGTSTVTVTGTSGSVTASTSFQLTIYAASFTLSTAYNSLNVNEGASTTNYVYVNAVYGFSGSVALTASGVPTGVTASFSTNPATSSSAMLLSVGSNATPGSSLVTVTGISGSITSSTSFALTVNPPTFTLSSTPASVYLFPGGTEKSTITVTPVSGVPGSVTYSATGLPSGVTASFSPNPSSTTSTLTLSAGSTATPVSGNIVVTGTSGSAIATTNVAVTVRSAQAATTTHLALTAGGSPVSSVASGTLVTATVTVTAGTTPLTTGQINLCNAAATLCDTAHLVGTAALTSAGTAVLRFIPGPGPHNYKATFAATNAAATSTSATTNLAVTATLPTVTTIATTGSAGNYSLTGTVTGSGPIAPTGNVSFLDTSDSNFNLRSGALSASTPVYSLNPSNFLPAGGDGPILSGDFNGDGIPDMVSAGVASTTLTVLLGIGNGRFNFYNVGVQTSSTLTYLAAGDFNRDGKLDLAVTLANSTVVILLGNGDGTFTQTATTFPTGLKPVGMAVADYNGDGLQDIAVLNSGSNTVTILLGNGDGTFTVSNSSPQTGSDPQTIVVGDFNGDSIPDLAVTNYQSASVSILLGNGDGTFTPAASLAAGTYPSGIAAGDLNGDGKLDLAVTNFNSNTITILLGNGDGTFTPAANTIPTGPVPTVIAIADFNNDGHEDLVAVIAEVPPGGITVLPGNGDGTFAASLTIMTGYSFWSVTVADWNGDGLPDIGCNRGIDDDAFLSSLAQTATATVTGVAPIGTGTHLVAASFPGSSIYTASTSATTSLTGASSAAAPNVTLSFLPASISTAQSVTATVTVSGGSANPIPTGTVLVESLTYRSATTPLINGVATIVIPAGTLAAGTEQLLAIYFPDSASSTIYASAQGTATIAVSQFTANSIWIANGNGSVSGLTQTGTAVTPSSLSAGGTAVAVDSGGDIWSLSQSTSSLAEFSPTDSILSSGYTGGGLTSPTALAIDGNGVLWIANGNNSVSAFTNVGTPVSATAYSTSIPAPTSINVDSSGNLWITSAGDNSVTQMIGVASPVTTPAATAVKNNTIATRP